MQVDHISLFDFVNSIGGVYLKIYCQQNLLDSNFKIEFNKFLETNSISVD